MKDRTKNSTDKGNYVITHYVEPYYIDVLNKETISDFINVTHYE